MKRKQCVRVPNITFLHALVAGLRRCFSIATPGIVTLPVLVTSRDTICARQPSTPTHCLRFISILSAIASASATLLIAFGLALAFIAAFMFVWGAVVRRRAAG